MYLISKAILLTKKRIKLNIGNTHRQIDKIQTNKANSVLIKNGKMDKKIKTKKSEH